MALEPGHRLEGRAIFITGTNTGAGKTVLTALLLAHLLERGVTARGLKPFCSGDRTDAQLLYDLQENRVPLDQINPWHFPYPVSPWRAARLQGVSIHKTAASDWWRDQQKRSPLLLVEGAGGLLAPLGEDFTALDLIEEFQPQVLLAAANQLGVVNHVRLTLHALPKSVPVRVVLIDTSNPDASASTNLEDLQLLTERTVISLPFVPNFRPEAAVVRAAAKNLAAELASLISPQ